MALNLLDFLTPVARDALVLVVDSMKCAVSRSGVSGAGAVFRVAEGGGLVCGIQFISPSQQSRYIAVGLSLKFKSATHMHVQLTANGNMASLESAATSCGTGRKTRYPFITQRAQNGGRPCPPFARNRDPDVDECILQPCTTEDSNGGNRMLGSSAQAHFMAKLLEKYYEGKN
ncbi:hypothetical protein GBAR_LOCUS21229 [Geodia barretti]|uniref:Uncharacterized protein n=1 Tax=Geodia barretti TaxID=519541 RepID=A0AA35X4T0_GEOBA|nr:hypothetical protein GBAR_LOCUS21229 [Geodia barretti]